MQLLLIKIQNIERCSIKVVVLNFQCRCDVDCLRRSVGAGCAYPKNCYKIYGNFPDFVLPDSCET